MAKILIVEDDDATRTGYREFLRLAGHEVIATSSYQEGRQAAATESPDLVIADHARTTAFLIAEGVMPERQKREYVLRRVMRRAVRHGHRLGIEQPFFHDVALEVVRHMGETYPELRDRRDLIARAERATVPLDPDSRHDDQVGSEAPQLPGHLGAEIDADAPSAAQIANVGCQPSGSASTGSARPLTITAAGIADCLMPNARPWRSIGTARAM